MSDNDGDAEEDEEPENAQLRQRQPGFIYADLEDANGDIVRQKLPIKVVDGYKKSWSVRTTGTLPLYRTRKLATSHGDAFFYQQIVLYYPCSNFNNLRHDGESWKDVFRRLVETNMLHPRIPESFYTSDDPPINDPVNNQMEIDSMLESLNLIQYEIFSNLIINIRQSIPSIVLGGAGTGKSYLLKLLCLHFEQEGYKVAELAPTGIAPFNIQGSTYHSFFGIDTATGKIKSIQGRSGS